ncbi:MAG: hypothetical protein Q9191_007110 [Dirinaria sp. TL-2023a]
MVIKFRSMATKRLTSSLLRRLPGQILPLPDYLVPALSTASSSRHFSIPPEVNLKLLEPPPKRKLVSRVESPRVLEIEGPLGKLSLEMAPYLTFEHDESTRKASISVQDRNERQQRAMWGACVIFLIDPKILTSTGTTRAYLNNYVMGVSEGHTAILRLVGVGYRATVEPSAVTVQPEYPGQHFVSLKVGYSHPIELGVPPGMKASTPQPTLILLEGVDKEVVMQFAAKIRKWRRPEPYKGKGIFVNGETIKLKAKKIK